MSTPTPAPSAPTASWWPLTKKIRVVAAAILAADVSSLVAWLNHSTNGAAALITAILATSALVGGYLTSDA